MTPALSRWIVAVLAAATLIIAGWNLHRQAAGLQIQSGQTAGVPWTAYRLPSARAAPAIVIAHGFAGSRQLMLPFATTLARRGYVAVVFDFPGHARNPSALPAGLTDRAAMQDALTAALHSMVNTARSLPGSDGRVALLGHSMAAELVLRYGHQQPTVAGTVAVSLFLPEPQPWNPRNLLIIDGALEAPMLREQGLARISQAIAQPAQLATTYGDFAAGDARRIVFAPGVEHIGVLYSRHALHEAAAWMDGVFARNPPADFAVDRRGPWLGAWLLGVVVLAWPLCALLPRVAAVRPRAAAGWPWLLPVALIPALATPLLLRLVPAQFLPLLLGDYLILHFALYGLLTMALIAARPPPYTAPMPLRADGRRLVLAVLTVVGFSAIAIVWPLDVYAFSLGPAPWRLPLVALLALGILPWFVADEWLTRRLAPLPGAYAMTKLCFLASLLLAIALDLRRLFFLVILIPAILLLFGVYGTFSAWVQRRTGHPLVAAIAHAWVFAWFIGMSFPLVD